MLVKGVPLCLLLLGIGILFAVKAIAEKGGEEGKNDFGSRTADGKGHSEIVKKHDEGSKRNHETKHRKHGKQAKKKHSKDKRHKVVAKRYDGYVMLRLEVPDNRSQNLISQLKDVTFLTGPWTGDFCTILVSPNRLKASIRWLKEKSIKFQVTSKNLQTTIDQEKNLIRQVNLREAAFRRRGEGENHKMTWTNYHRRRDFLTYFNYLLDKYPNRVKKQTLGTTHTRNEIAIVTVCSGKCGDKPGIFIEGGIHAREWISPAVVTFVLNRLLKNATRHPKWLSEFDWYFSPITNPDGYDYSWKVDRMWRKNRNPNEKCRDPYNCYGVDLNRNFGYKWNLTGTPIENFNMSGDTYKGPFAFSEKETYALQRFFMKNRGNIVFYATIHSYGQMVMLPWAWTTIQQPNRDSLLYKTATRAAAAMEGVDAKHYKVGLVTELLPGQIFPGSSLDWIFAVARVPFTVAIEVRDRGQHGFLLPAKQIVKTGEEVWAFLRVFVDELLNH